MAPVDGGVLESTDLNDGHGASAKQTHAARATPTRDKACADLANAHEIFRIPSDIIPVV